MTYHVYCPHNGVTARQMRHAYPDPEAARKAGSRLSLIPHSGGRHVDFWVVALDGTTLMCGESDTGTGLYGKFCVGCTSAVAKMSEILS